MDRAGADFDSLPLDCPYCPNRPAVQRNTQHLRFNTSLHAEITNQASAKGNLISIDAESRDQNLYEFLPYGYRPIVKGNRSVLANSAVILRKHIAAQILHGFTVTIRDGNEFRNGRRIPSTLA